MKTTEPKKDKNGVWSQDVIRPGYNKITVMSKNLDTVTKFVQRLMCQKGVENGK